MRRRRLRKFRPRSLGRPRYRPPRGAAVVRRAGVRDETIRGISDLLAQRPDPALKARVDGYIARIEAVSYTHLDVYKRQVYDPAVGDPDGGIAPGTQFEEIPEDWVCPVCGVGKDMFEEVAE